MRAIILTIYTIISYLFLYPFTFLNVIVVIIFSTLGLQKAIPYVLSFWAKGTFMIIGKAFNIHGKENLNKENKYILMANHSSMFDIMGIMAICPSISWFGRSHLLKIPFFGKVLRIMNYIPMKSTDLRNAKQMIEHLIIKTENQTVAIFPEGTRTENGEMNNFRKGFLHVLKASELDILPVSLVGFYEFKPKNRFYFNYSKTLSATIHKPIPFSVLNGLDDEEVISIIQSKIESPLI